MDPEKEKMVLQLLEELEKDETVFPQILKLISSEIINLAYRYTGNLEDAKDIFQEVSLKLFKALGSFRHKARFSTWVYRITVNACIDFLRKKKVSFKIEEGLAGEEETTREQLQRKERKLILKEAVGRLSPVQKNVFILRHYQGLKIAQISKILRCSPSTVKTHLARAISNLRKIVESGKIGGEIK